MKKILLSCIIVFSIFFCKKEDNETYWYNYSETWCADKWKKYPSNTDEELKSAIGKYCSENQITIYAIKINFDSTKMEDCSSCLCTSGRIIEVSSPHKNDTSLLNLGFYKEP